MVVRMRHTRAHTKNRRAHHALKSPALAVCANCGSQHRPHHMCLSCGFYKGRQIMDLAARTQQRKERMQSKRDRIKAQNTPEAEPEATPEVLEDEKK